MLSVPVLAQKTAQALPKVITESFTVYGVCGECKERIEAAVDIKGVKIANYDISKETLTITYKTKKLSRAQIHQTIADAGHDTCDIQASDSAYNGLSACCKYRDPNNPHKCEDHKEESQDQDDRK
jgi:periplasmic mercuric ion binding protein